MGYNFLTAMGAMGFRKGRNGIFNLNILASFAPSWRTLRLNQITMPSLPELYLLFALMGYNFLSAMGAKGIRKVRKGIFQLKHLSVPCS